MFRGSPAFSGKIHRPFLAHVVPPLASRISRRRLVAKVGAFENRKVHKHLHLWLLGHHRRRLAVRSGTSKGSTVSQYGCSTFGALATEGQQKEEKAFLHVSVHLCHLQGVLTLYCAKVIKLFKLQLNKISRLKCSRDCSHYTPIQETPTYGLHL